MISIIIYTFLYIMDRFSIDTPEVIRENHLIAINNDNIEDITWWREDMNFMFECKNNILRMSTANV